jgi:hypothetical protein
MKNFYKVVSLILITMLTTVCSFTSFSQIIIGSKPADKPTEDTTKKPELRIPIKPYASVITKNFTSKRGLFTVHFYRDQYYFEIPDSILGQSIMVISRLTKAPGAHGMYPGEELGSKTMYFEKGPDSSIRIRYDLLINEADSSDQIYKAVVSSSQNPLVASFGVVAKGNQSSVIEVTKLLKDPKSFINAIDPGTELANNAMTNAQREIYVESVRAYPVNIEIGISKTMDSKSKLFPAGTPASIESNISFIALPKKPMQRRYFDSRVGFFADYFYEFGDKQQKAETRQFILRWRMEPKQEDMEKWRRGELVEPQKPIVIYIDPATPKQWRPYLIAGINDWQKAFEQAGFKQAIVGKEWPENDTTMQVEDARYSFVRYLPSEIRNAYGPNIHDPRSGEIIQTHIGWYHNVMSLLHNWYMIQAGAVDSRARNAVFDEKLMGELIRFVSSHEVGHTMGLRHNFGSSNRTPVDSLRSNSYLAKFGHTASIMDYARFNYVAQPEDNIQVENLFPRIGEYDKWAIEWGYKFINAANADEDKRIVQGWVGKRLKENPRLWFGDGETKKFDPRCQTEDLGDNPMKANTYGIKNLQRILPELPKWTYEKGGMYENLASAYTQLKNQYFRYMLHAVKYVGGVYYTDRNDGDNDHAYEAVPRATQLDALQFYNKHLFQTPLWILNKDVINQVNLPDGANFVEDIQVRVLNSLLDIALINKIMANEKQFGSRSLALQEYIGFLHKAIWSDINGTDVIKTDTYRRGLQKTYLGALTAILSSKEPANNETDASSILKADIFILQSEIKKALTRATDPMTQIHLKDLQSRIQMLLNPKV